MCLFVWCPYSQQSQVKESTQALPVQMEVPVEEGGEGGGGGGELPARYERDLVQKLKLLRHELSLQQPQAGHCRIEVSREEIFEVTILSQLPQQLGSQTSFSLRFCQGNSGTSDAASSLHSGPDG